MVPPYPASNENSRLGERKKHGFSRIAAAHQTTDELSSFRKALRVRSGQQHAAASIHRRDKLRQNQLRHERERSKRRQPGQSRIAIPFFPERPDSDLLMPRSSRVQQRWSGKGRTTSHRLALAIVQPSGIQALSHRRSSLSGTATGA